MNQKNPRPKIDIKMSRFDYVLEVIALVTLLITWAMILYYMPSLPNKVVTHYNFKGEADGHGSKGSLYILGGLSAILYVGLSFITRFTHHFNYIVPITDENAAQQYKLAARGFRVIKGYIMIVLAYSIYQTIKNASGGEATLGSAFVPIFLIGHFGMLFTYLIMSTSKNIMVEI